MNDLSKTIKEGLVKVKKASRRLVGLTEEDVRDILYQVADLTMARKEDILKANAKDLDRMDPENPKYDRLLLDESRLAAIADDMRKVADLPSPLNQVLDETTRPNGLRIQRVSVPIGVVGIIYESRPNVTFDVFALCLRSGNACVLKGSRDAHDSNIAIVSIIREVLAPYELEEVVFLAPSAREALPLILEAEDYIDCAIPRGSQGLISFVRENARIPVIETGAGIVHTYVDADADLEKAKSIVQNAKTRRVSVCNALDCLVIHEDRLRDLPEIVGGMDKSHRVVIHADSASFSAIKGSYEENLLKEAIEEDFGVEWLSHQMSIRTVSSLDEALDHIARYSSRHSETIVSENQQHLDVFLKHVDAACVYANASTAFSDGGEFGLGAEIGISTQKLHARGPMGLRELTSYKWIVRGEGHVRN